MLGRAVQACSVGAPGQPAGAASSRQGRSGAPVAAPRPSAARWQPCGGSGSGSGGVCQQQQQRSRPWLQPPRGVVDGAGASMTIAESSWEEYDERLHGAMEEAKAAGVRLRPSLEVLQLIREADAFTFDVDSTFCADESIDEIAAFLGVGEQVAALTAKAMGGSVLFQDALAERLGVMHPSRDDLQRFLQGHPPQISPGIPELVQVLKAAGKEVFLVSGGFRIVIHPIAEMLGIPVDHVFANTILFDHDGAYDGFDPAEFPSRSGGKAEAVKHIKQAHGYKRVIMVGDGMTDFEARAPGGADAFIGYGGVVYRENVALKSDWYVFEIHQITRAVRAATKGGDNGSGA